MRLPERDRFHRISSTLLSVEHAMIVGSNKMAGSQAKLIGLNPKMRTALKLLWEGRSYAQNTDQDPWEFAVEIKTFTQLALTPNDLRWLVYNGLAEHGREITEAAQARRTFRPECNLRFSDRTCFILTERGAALAERILRQAEEEQRQETPIPPAEPPEKKIIPHWDAVRHELRVGGLLVKQFKLPSPNQETILSAFEEEGWPPQIDDPLPPHPDQDPKRRLQDALKGLNRAQKNPLIRFMGDGTGQGILWKYVPATTEHYEY